eukprot:scaffold7682_cov139-Ochromonas_danica.AAC.1
MNCAVCAQLCTVWQSLEELNFVPEDGSAEKLIHRRREDMVFKEIIIILVVNVMILPNAGGIKSSTLPGVR